MVGLYPSIPHDDGISALSDFVSSDHLPIAICNGICQLARLVLKSNIFEFDDKLFLQLLGTAIGTKMAPNFSNVFMDRLERNFFASSSYKPIVWWRFIDDIFAIWNWGVERLHEFMTCLNAFHPTVKFTYEYSDTTVHFLDVNVSIGPDRTLVTDVFTKPTDTHQYLFATSCHPGHTKRNIAYSQALRICRICSDFSLARLRCSELESFLVRRGHSRKNVKRGIQKALDSFCRSDNSSSANDGSYLANDLSRSHDERSFPKNDHSSENVDTRPYDLARTKNGMVTDTFGNRPPLQRDLCSKQRIPLVIDYHPALPDITGILRKYQHLLHCFGSSQASL